MVETWYVHPIYWVILFTFFLVFLRLLDAPILTPYFLTALFLSQTLAVLIIELPSITYISIIGILGVFLFSIAQVIKINNHGRLKFANKLLLYFERTYHFQLQKNYLAFFVILIIFLMIINTNWDNGYLSLLIQTEDERSLDRKSNILMQLASLGIPSLISLLLVKKSINIYLKIFTLIIYSILLLLSGSKSGFASLLIIFFGFLYWTEFKIKLLHIATGGFLVLLGPFAVFNLYSERFGINSADVRSIYDSLSFFLDKLIYRIVANNDQLELLMYSNLSIYDYPFYGPLQLIDPFIKALGLRSLGFEYSPGEWLYGVIFGNWSGVGPNPTFVIEFPQALGPLSVILMYLIGRIFKFVRLQKKIELFFPIYCMLPVIIVDISLFEMKLIGYIFLLSLVMIFTIMINAFKHYLVKNSI